MTAVFFDAQWNAATAESCPIICDGEGESSKSAERRVDFMASGMPVVDLFLHTLALVQGRYSTVPREYKCPILEPPRRDCGHKATNLRITQTRTSPTLLQGE